MDSSTWGENKIIFWHFLGYYADFSGFLGRNSRKDPRNFSTLAVSKNLFPAKFYDNRCTESPLRGDEPKNANKKEFWYRPFCRLWTDKRENRSQLTGNNLVAIIRVATNILTPDYAELQAWQNHKFKWHKVTNMQFILSKIPAIKTATNILLNYIKSLHRCTWNVVVKYVK